ncbi:TRAP transporter substrate-binding protein [Arenibaculum sp.]|jgi:TRAP-type C4-dicarboxylate transport system substrate-binding protein|uniref:TRAP transporter substrate-binding protein n=1 Tax=Arenibaculum sp. TaxID=2865862 RepID=UPI002E12D8D6|nr:TRAP transporter substrate-binding protein [Arenibaculum sp.]
MNKLVSIAVAGAVSVLASTAAFAQEKWDLPAGYPPGNFHSKNLEQFADDVRTGTDGKLDITVHPGASLFKVPEIKRAVQTGQAQIGELLMVVLENEDPIFGVDNVPFLATSFDDARKLADAQRPFVEKRLADQGMRLLYWVPWPPQGFYSPKPLETIDDLAGLKFRSYGPSAARLGELAGMQVTTVQAAELSQAFATGRVNAMISSGSTGYDSKLWEHVTHFYDVQAWLPKNMIIVNEQAWQGLDEATRAAVTEAAATAEERGWAESERLTNFYLDEFRKNGMTVSAPSEALKAGFRDIGEELQADWVARAGADGEALLSAYRGN